MRTINVGIDNQTFVLQNTGGISRYFASLLSAKFSNSPIAVAPLFDRHRNHYLANTGIGTYDNEVSIAGMISEYPVEFSSMDQPADMIVHSTYYQGFPSRYKKNIHVASLYDMIPEMYPEMFPHGNPHANKKIWLDECDAIISISQASAYELLQLMPHVKSKLKVIHLGFDRIDSIEQKSEEIASSIGWPKYQYYLFVGSRQAYKNGLMLLKAYIASSAHQQNIHLIFAGGGNPSQNEKELVINNSLQDKVHYLMPSDLDLYILYKYASAVVVPSLAEGFSLPLIESLCFDAPLICSEIPVHVEIGGNYAHLVSPVMGSCWSEILSSPQSLRRPSKYLNSRYPELLKYYSINRMVEEHHSFYASLL